MCVNIDHNIRAECSGVVTVSSYKTELAKKETMLAALQKDISSLGAKYSEHQKRMEDDMLSKCAAAECKWIACFR